MRCEKYCDCATQLRAEVERLERDFHTEWGLALKRLNQLSQAQADCEAMKDAIIRAHGHPSLQACGCPLCVVLSTPNPGARTLEENAKLKADCEALRKALGELKRISHWYAVIHNGPDNEVHHALKVEVQSIAEKALLHPHPGAPLLERYRKALESIRDNCACDTPEVCYDVACDALEAPTSEAPEIKRNPCNAERMAKLEETASFARMLMNHVESYYLEGGADEDDLFKMTKAYVENLKSALERSGKGDENDSRA